MIDSSSGWIRSEWKRQEKWICSTRRCNPFRNGTDVRLNGITTSTFRLVHQPGIRNPECFKTPTPAAPKHLRRVRRLRPSLLPANITALRPATTKASARRNPSGTPKVHPCSLTSTAILPCGPSAGSSPSGLLPEAKRIPALRPSAMRWSSRWIILPNQWRNIIWDRMVIRSIHPHRNTPSLSSIHPQNSQNRIQVHFHLIHLIPVIELN